VLDGVLVDAGAALPLVDAGASSPLVDATLPGAENAALACAMYLSVARRAESSIAGASSFHHSGTRFSSSRNTQSFWSDW
jgi:hypothetical protein